MNCTKCNKRMSTKDLEVKEIIKSTALTECRDCYTDSLSIPLLREFNDLNKAFYENKEKNIFKTVEVTKIQTNH